MEEIFLWWIVLEYAIWNMVNSQIWEEKQSLIKKKSYIQTVGETTYRLW